MKPALIAMAAAIAVGACSNAQTPATDQASDAAPSVSTKGLKGPMARCAIRADGASYVIASYKAGTRDPSQAEFAKNLITVCSDTITTLERTHAGSRCIEVARFFEAYGQQLLTAFETQGDLPKTDRQAEAKLTADMDACLAEMPAQNGGLTGE